MRAPDPMEIHIDLTPPPSEPEATQPAAPADVVSVVVDVLRAGLVTTRLLERGADAVILGASVRAARQRAAAIGALLVGDVGGVPPEGFNHPATTASVRSIECTGRDVVLLADDAPHALAGVRSRCVLAGLVNALAVVETVMAWDPASVVVVCAGDRGEPDLADAIAAGLLVSLFEREARARGDAGPVVTGATRFCLSVLRTTKDPLDGVWSSSAGSELRAVGLEEEVAAASEIATSDVVPLVAAIDHAFGRPLVRLVRA
jgi:2-phosphosulfolactate phosphatase